MKNISFPFRIIAYVATLMFIITGCKDLLNIDPGKDLKLIVKYKPADAFIEAIVKDAKTGEFVTSKINVEIISKQASNIINFEGDSKNSYTKSGPSIYLGLLKTVPTQISPQSFKIVVSAEGYLSNSKDVTLRGIKNGLVEIRLVKISDLPPGSASNQATFGTSTNGNVIEDKVIAIQNGNNTTSVAVKAGTTMKDENGSVISGAINATVVTFTGNNSQAVRALPGGNSLVLTNLPKGSSQAKGSLMPLSFASVEMKDAQGKKVSTFSEPINITFELSAGTFNPKTKTKIKEGDSFSVFSYKENTGTWSYETEGTVYKKGDEFFVTFPTKHLTWFELDRRYTNEYGASLANSVVINLFIDDMQTLVPDENGYITEPFLYGEFSIYGNHGDFLPTLDLTQRDPTEYKIANNVYGNYQSIGKFYRIEVGEIGTFYETNRMTLWINYLNAFKTFNIDFSKFDLTPESKVVTIRTTFGQNLITQKTAFFNVTCENNCPLDVKPYFIGMMYYDEGFKSWEYLGTVDYDPVDKKTKMKTTFPDNTTFKLNAIQFPEPEYTITANTGTGSTYEIPIVLKKSHPLCNCGK
jgi:hypothetical protein